MTIVNTIAETAEMRIYIHIYIDISFMSVGVFDDDDARMRLLTFPAHKEPL